MKSSAGRHDPRFRGLDGNLVFGVGSTPKISKRGPLAPVRATVLALAGLAATLGFASSAPAATINVTKTQDPTPNGCKKNDCSLREATIKANDTPASDTIKLGARTYKLTLEPTDSGFSGGLLASEDARIVGKGPSKTTIQGAFPTQPDRLLFVSGSGTSATLSGLTLRGGNAGPLAEGGAVFADDGTTVKLNRVNAVENSAHITGAVASYGRAVLSKVVFRKNEAVASCCGALYINAGTAKLTNVTFDRNEAASDTGAMYVNGDKATLRNVTFSNNHGGGLGGGALILSTGLTTITNATFAGNEDTGEAGAIRNESGSTATLSNVTITDNVADSDASGAGHDGGGISVAGGTVNIKNTLLGGNSDTTGEAPDCSVTGGNLVSLGHNLIGDTTGCAFTPAGSDLTDIGALKLAPLADNGAFTSTVALKKGSPAINKGSGKKPGSGGAACAKRDQRNVKRPQGPRCDVGAYERKR